MADTSHARCMGKICYSYREACQMINDTRKRQHRSSSKRIPRRCYYCEVCHCYHLTSAPDFWKD